MAGVKANVPYVFLHPAWRGGVVLVQGPRRHGGLGPGGLRRRLPGPREPSRGDRDVALADYPRAVVEFIEERGLDRVVLVGNSTGGLVCQLTAQEIPDRIAHTYDFVPVRNSRKNADSPYELLILDAYVTEAGLSSEEEGYDAVVMDTVSDSGLKRSGHGSRFRCSVRGKRSNMSLQSGNGSRS